MGSTTRRTVPVMTTDGMGVVSHAGTVLLVELVDWIGLTTLSKQATDRLRERRGGHDPGRVLVDVAVADAAVTITDIQALADHQGLHGPARTVRQTRRQGTELAIENPFLVGAHEDNRKPTYAAVPRLIRLLIRAISGYRFAFLDENRAQNTPRDVAGIGGKPVRPTPRD